MARDAALELLKTDLPQNVYMAVFVIDHKLEALQPFTNDRDLLKNAIDRATRSENTDFSADSAGVQRQLEQMVGPATGGNTSLESRVGQASDLAGTSGTAQANAAMACMLLSILSDEQSNAMAEASRVQVYSLLDAVRQQYQLPGRKTVLYFSNGLYVSEATKHTLADLESMANRNNVSIYAIDSRGLITTSMNQGSMDALNGAVAASKRNQTNPNDAVTMDQAKAMNNGVESTRANTQENLASLAQGTGGFLIASTNDFHTRCVAWLKTSRPTTN